MNDMMQRLIVVWTGLEQRVIDDTIDNRRRRLCTRVRATGR